MKTPDSIQLATALAGNAAAFLTNDAGIATIPGLQLVVLDSLLKNPQP
jgi:predicted nucleic acid-binding protein